jgi:cobalt transporter subunit CbtA
MIRRVLSVAVLTGLLTGLVMAVVLQFTTTPLILKAEVYERAAHAAQEGKSVLIARPRFAMTPILTVHDEHAHATAAAHEDEGWQPAEGLQRSLATSVATIAVAIGYALILLGAMLVGRESITVRTGLAWGLAGFVATGLAPALGLAPELPGSAAAELLMRQTWWGATVLMTAFGLYLLLRRAQPLGKVAGLALVVAPHLIGAPHTAVFESTAPAELAAQFAATSLVVHAIMWALLGLGVGWLWTRQSAAAPAAARSA